MTFTGPVLVNHLDHARLFVSSHFPYWGQQEGRVESQGLISQEDEMPGAMFRFSPGLKLVYVSHTSYPSNMHLETEAPRAIVACLTSHTVSDGAGVLLQICLHQSPNWCSHICAVRPFLGEQV